MQKKAARNKDFHTILHMLWRDRVDTEMENFKPVSTLLDMPDRMLGTLATRLRERADLLVAVQQALPVRLAAEVSSAGLDRGRLTVGVSSAAWAARLRYYANDLRKAVGTTMRTTILCVRLRVVPAAGEARSARR